MLALKLLTTALIWQAASISAQSPEDEEEEVRIAKGREAKIEEAPWTVAVLRALQGSDPPYTWLGCTGALIEGGKNQIVVTVPHCLTRNPGAYPATAYAVSAGSNHFENGGQIRRARKFVIHEGFKWSYPGNVIALLFLAEDFTLSKQIDTLSLPPQGMEFIGNKVLVTGWGTSDRAKPHQVLQKMELEVLQNSFCKAWVIQIKKDNICTFSRGNAGICNADRGAPAALKILDHTFLTGIAEYGGCGKDKKQPDIFTAVSWHSDWIKEQIAKDMSSRDFQDDIEYQGEYRLDYY